MGQIRSRLVPAGQNIKAIAFCLSPVEVRKELGCWVWQEPFCGQAVGWINISVNWWSHLCGSLVLQWNRLCSAWDQTLLNSSSQLPANAGPLQKQPFEERFSFFFFPPSLLPPLYKVAFQIGMNKSFFFFWNEWIFTKNPAHLCGVQRAHKFWNITSEVDSVLFLINRRLSAHHFTAKPQSLCH